MNNTRWKILIIFSLDVKISQRGLEVGSYKDLVHIFLNDLTKYCKLFQSTKSTSIDDFPNFYCVGMVTVKLFRYLALSKLNLGQFKRWRNSSPLSPDITLCHNPFIVSFENCRCVVHGIAIYNYFSELLDPSHKIYGLTS